MVYGGRGKMGRQKVASFMKLIGPKESSCREDKENEDTFSDRQTWCPDRSRQATVVVVQ